MSKQNGPYMAPQPIRMPPLKPQGISLWFRMLEKQFEAAGIERDVDKVNILFGCLEPEYLERFYDVDFESAGDKQYDRLKEELIRSLAESDSERGKMLAEKEVMGDRKPSQFYHDLKKLAGPFASEQFVLDLWKKRLPERIRRVLAVMDDTKPEKIIQAADRVEEACSGSEQHENSITAMSKPEVQVDPSHKILSEIRDVILQILQLSTKMSAMSISDRRRARSRSRSPKRRRRRSSSRNGLCYYHDLYRERARKCRSPCRWKQGNESSRP